MEANPYFISCDWGTSNFRLRLVDGKTLSVLAEHSTDQGVKPVYERFLNQKNLDQTAYFTNYLLEQVQKITDGQELPKVVIAGMASSNIGLYELEYGEMPFDGEGQGVNFKQLKTKTGLDIILISGIKDKDGVMRGEETQALGLLSYLETYSRGVLILPGTHSKHVTYEMGSFTKLRSFMTGELFELLSQKSILANNVESGQWIDKRKDAFKEGLAIGFKKELSSHLFSIRAKHLLENTNKKNNYFMLSGMLIGDELSYLKNWKEKIFLAAPEPIFSMYKLALSTLLPEDQIVSFGENVLEKALILGQLKILEGNEK